MAARPTRLVAAGALVLCGLAACTSDPDPVQSPTAAPSMSSSADADLAAFYDQELSWDGCGGGFDCATLTVPADYANPTAGTVEIEVVRLKADDPQGSLVLNPGGPGGSGVDYARAARGVLTPQLAGAYDVVGFDPRGVVSSTPVDCIDDSELDALFAADGTPDTPEEVAELADSSAEFGQGCKTLSPDIAPYMDTESAARDLDILRAALGDDQLNYLGKSYGTYLGPSTPSCSRTGSGRMLLDGVLPSSLDSDEITLGQAKAFDMVLRRFVEDCITKEDCPLPRDVDAGVARIQQFLADLDQDPLPGIGDRDAHRGAGDLRDPELPVLPADGLGCPALRPRDRLPGRRQRADGHDGQPDPAPPRRDVRQQRQRGVLRGVVPGPTGGRWRRPRAAAGRGVGDRGPRVRARTWPGGTCRAGSGRWALGRPRRPGSCRSSAPRARRRSSS